MTLRRIIVGDVHGHYEALIMLMQEIAPNKNEPVYFLGDLIDRGPHSSQVVDFVKTHHYHCLLGNHEQMLLEVLGTHKPAGEAFQGWLYSGGYSTLLSYNHRIPQQHIDWFKTLPLYLDLGDIWLVHAGVDPDMLLFDQSATQFCWIRDEFHSMTEPYFSDKLIITGHTITFTFPGVEPGQLVRGAGWLDIDTGAYHPYSNWLTALDVTNNLVYQVHTQDKTLRKLPLDEISVQIKPDQVQAKRLQQTS
ncbi:MAG: Bis(5'-nucleosyl)-tetraphosphatase, symmetrical [Chroococcopsis gigantea SAG 12.99]|jgi:serine/threonine protein phosphatase 1|nr:serine/threonine protein phosphatase [Chlorogloea purpurea SAG 13.99]MDV3000725.1 Bis(5'-nucleosyl)-tetraphosphatase, symmetrical [Chroococcopsis gigantea SAG 12.99]